MLNFNPTNMETQRKRKQQGKENEREKRRIEGERKNNEKMMDKER